MDAKTFTAQRPSRSLLFGLGVALLIGSALLALSLFFARPSSAPLAPAADLTQMSEGGGVTVRATWLANQTAPTFFVALDTHSIALDGYDLRERQSSASVGARSSR